MAADEAEKAVVFYVGARRLVALAGEILPGGMRVLAYAGEDQPEGFLNGFVAHLDKAAKTVTRVFDKLKDSREGQFLKDAAGREIYVVLGNAKLSSYTFSSCQYYAAARKTLTHHDVHGVIEQTRSIATLPLTEHVLATLPSSFLVDDLDHVPDPVGLEAERLGVTLKIYTMDGSEFKNLAKVFESAELEIKTFFPRMLAVSEAVLTERERQDGVLLLDLGSDCIYLSLWRGGMMTSTRIAEIGVKKLIEAVSQNWQIGFPDAAKVLDRYGSLVQEPDFGEELIPLVVRDTQEKKQVERRVFHASLLKLSRDWLAEVLAEADGFVRENGLFHPHYVFTGSGTRWDGFLEFLNKEFSTDARLGVLRSVEAPNELKIHPGLSAAIGGLHLIAKFEKEKRQYLKSRGLVEKTLSQAREWLAAYF